MPVYVVYTRGHHLLNGVLYRLCGGANHASDAGEATEQRSRHARFCQLVECLAKTGEGGTDGVNRVV